MTPQAKIRLLLESSDPGPFLIDDSGVAEFDRAELLTLAQDVERQGDLLKLADELAEEVLARADIYTPETVLESSRRYLSARGKK